jgi:hypothetical protein
MPAVLGCSSRSKGERRIFEARDKAEEETETDVERKSSCSPAGLKGESLV